MATSHSHGSLGVIGHFYSHLDRIRADPAHPQQSLAALLLAKPIRPLAVEPSPLEIVFRNGLPSGDRVYADHVEWIVDRIFAIAKSRFTPFVLPGVALLDSFAASQAQVEQICIAFEDNMARVADGLDDPAEAQSKMVAAFIEQHFTMPNLLIILGHSFTVGSSQNTLPPMVEDCFGSFALRHPRDLKNAIGLTVGAKAWSKHAHRATTGYWGSVKGTTQDKNETAAKLLARIFSEAVWFNIHALPHKIRVYEIRTLQGYGARWYLTEEPLPPADDPEPGTDPDPDAAAPDRIDAPAKARPESLGAKLRISGTMAIEFRGFLEPFMENGHEVGWVH